MAISQPFQFITKGELTYLIFKPWEDSTMTHCFTTRSGGVSKGHLASLNLGFNRGDEEANVIENYKRVCNALNVPFDSLVLSKQVHEIEIIRVTKENQGNGILYPNKWESMDGIYTREKGVTLVTHYADCVPLFFYAPDYGMIGMAHAGWRGTVGKIGQKMVNTWVQEEGIPIEAIQVAIGPSIGPCCFEVDSDVAGQFMQVFGKTSFIQPEEGTSKYRIDLWECNKQALIDAGISQKHIFVSGICTCCHEKIFFSHRKTKGERGTLGAFMCLNN